MQVSLQNISKSFGANTVLKPQSISFSSGHIYGIVGYNGCGKTVLLKCICGLLQPTGGNVVFLPDDSTTVPKPSCGVVIDGAGFIGTCHARQVLAMLANVSGKADKERIRWMLETVGLDPDDRRKIRNYSLGMRQRLAFAQALMEDPPVLLLDEPLNGLDYEGIQMVYRLLTEQKSRGKVILVASHHEEDIRLLCDEVYWLKDGVLEKISSVEIYTSFKKEQVISPIKSGV